MQTQKNYKNVGMQILVPNNSAEPLNAMFSRAKANAELSSSCSLEGCTTELEQVATNRIPVISKSGTPLMPCKPAKARKLLEQGKAIQKWSKLGIFYIQLTFDPTSEPNKNQKVVFGIDPGSKFDGYAVTTKIVNLTGMSELPSGIADKLETRRRMRRARRYRNTRQRPKRFDNRNREGFIAPSQKAKVEFRLKIIRELCKQNDVVRFKGKLARVGGFMEKRMSLHNYDLNNKRFTQNASPNNCGRLFNQRIMFEVEHGCRNVNPVYINARGQIPPVAKASGFPLTP